MGKQIFAGASFENEKYFFEKEYDKIPEIIQEEIRVICVTIAHKLECSFVMGFHEDGDIFFEVIKPEDSLDFDDIGAELEIKEIKRRKSELLNSLSLWYKVFKSNDSEDIKNQVLNGEI